MSTSLLEQSLVELCTKENWRGVIEISVQFTLEERSKFLWAWPTIECLLFLKSILVKNHINSILSIGCGSGLLEWIIKQSTGLDVIGLELDNSWWKSPYSPKTFIELKYTCSECVTNDFLTKCMNQNANKFALLFCYFNNRKAFLEYVYAYDGNIIIIIGPKNRMNIVTDPNPLDPQFDTDDWLLIDYIEMEDVQNCIAVYRRNS